MCLNGGKTLVNALQLAAANCRCYQKIHVPKPKCTTGKQVACVLLSLDGARSFLHVSIIIILLLEGFTIHNSVDTSQEEPRLYSSL